MCGLVLGDVRAMFFSIPKRCRHALSPLRHLYGVASGLVGNRKPTLAAHLTATTAHQGMAPRTTQAGATSGALDTHRLTLGDRRHVDCDIRDTLVIVILSLAINQLYGFRHATTRRPRSSAACLSVARGRGQDDVHSHGIVPRSQESHIYWYATALIHNQ